MHTHIKISKDPKNGAKGFTVALYYETTQVQTALNIQTHFTLGKKGLFFFLVTNDQAEYVKCSLSMACNIGHLTANSEDRTKP